MPSCNSLNSLFGSERSGWLDAKLEFGWIRVLCSGDMIRKAVLYSSHHGKSDPVLENLINRVWHNGLGELNLKFDMSGLSKFAQMVLGECVRIKFGEVMTYQELARRAGVPGAARAVGQVMAHNRFCIFFPCHRVIASHGELGGFTGGLNLKRRLLELEGWKVAGTGFNSRILKMVR
jgi:O-6-methylguanine DNA methyltransferase|uniref:methylated-DNA--[protein]-cysteine S-methyltransferase n=1 Tax=candidate division WOR-3 bacterium TaxID=2052148 RepID=A0A7V3PTR6_UNCW3